MHPGATNGQSMCVHVLLMDNTCACTPHLITIPGLLLFTHILVIDILLLIGTKNIYLDKPPTSLQTGQKGKRKVENTQNYT